MSNHEFFHNLAEEVETVISSSPIISSSPKSKVAKEGTTVSGKGPAKHRSTIISNSGTAIKAEKAESVLKKESESPYSIDEQPRDPGGIGVIGSNRYAYGTLKKKHMSFDDLEVTKIYMPPSIESVEGMKGHNPSDNEDFDTVRESIKIKKLDERTIVYAIFVDYKNENNNSMTAIRCFGGNALGGYAHDRSKDSYLVNCLECVHVGEVPFSLEVTMPAVGVWSTRIPIPQDVLEKHFTPQQKKLMEEHKKRYEGCSYEIHYMQLLGCS